MQSGGRPGRVVGLVILLLSLSAGLLGGCVPVGAPGVFASGLIVPADLETIYRQVAKQTGVPWAALAAWDAAQFELKLPTPPPDDIFQDLVQEELRQRRQGKQLTAKEELAIRERAVASARSLQRAHVEEHARALQPFIQELTQTPASAFARVLPDWKAVRAAELFEEYQVIELEQSTAQAKPQGAGTDSLTAAAKPASNLERVGRFVWPADGEVSSRYGLRRSPIDGVPRQHHGIDIAVNTGANVVASRPGVVEEAYFDATLGWVVIVGHGDGYQSLYAHNSKVLVKVGQVVSRRQVIALAGASGLATGPHLHFEIRYQGSQVNPILLLPAR